MKSERGLSTDNSILPLNTRDWVQYKLSLSVIKLTIYSITTSLIYKRD